MGHFFQISFGLSFSFGSESAFGAFPHPPMYAHASPSQDGFQQRGLLVTLTPWPHLLTTKELSSQEVLLDFENEKSVVSCLLSGQGPAFSPSCCAIFILKCWEWTPAIHPGRGRGGVHLSPASLGTFYIECDLVIERNIAFRPTRLC